MTAQPLPTAAIAIRPAPESRSPVIKITCARTEGAEAETDQWAQPPLPLWPETPPAAAMPVAPAHPPAPSVTAVSPASPGQLTPIMEANQWSATIALALFETLHGRRPVGQLTRWVDDRVQSAIAFHRRRAEPAAPGRPARLRSIRVQHPRADVAEVCAHLVLSGRSYALALRLEVWGERWLCTAVEFG